jgi:hypothetical protein
MRVSEVLAPIVTTIRTAHKARLRDASPGMVAALDQDHKFFVEMLEQTGIPLDRFTARDVYMLLFTVGLAWSVAQRAHDNGTLDRSQYEAAVMASSTAGYGVLAVLCPAWLASDSEAL